MVRRPCIGWDAPNRRDARLSQLQSPREAPHSDPVYAGRNGVSGRTESASKSPLWLRLSRLLRRLLRQPRLLLPVFEHFVVYRIDPRAVGPSNEHPDWTFRRLTDEEVAALQGRPGSDLLWRRFARLGVNDAFGIFIQDKLVHTRWLTTAETDRRLPDRILRLRSGEAESGLVYTLPEYRGRGLQPYGIRGICSIAAARGVTRVLSVTKADNHSSRRGLMKGGFRPCGRLFRLRLTWLPSWATLRWPGHRIGRGWPQHGAQ